MAVLHRSYCIQIYVITSVIKTHGVKYCETVCERNGKNLFWSVKNSGEMHDKLKSKGFLASSLSTYCSTLYITLPHNVIKEQLTDLIDTFLTEMAHFIWCVMRNAHFSHPENLKNIVCGHVRMFVMFSIIFWTVYL